MKPLMVGVISDTHGLLRPEALEAMRGACAIIHAGDIGDTRILEELNEIAPVTAVRGNIDTARWARKLPLTNALQVSNAGIYVLHNVDDLDLDPLAGGFAAVVFGHSHNPLMEQRNAVLFFNPGSAGPRRFSLPISVGKLMVTDAGIKPELITLQVS
jgi:uncharacterized protein